MGVLNPRHFMSLLLSLWTTCMTCWEVTSSKAIGNSLGDGKIVWTMCYGNGVVIGQIVAASNCDWLLSIS